MQNLKFYIASFLLVIPTLVCATEVELVKIRSAESRHNVQIYMTFKASPTFRHVHKGKRVDIVLETILSNTEPITFPTNDKVVKFLTLQRPNETVLSFFLRYEPQKIKVSRQSNTTLVLDILLGNQFTKAYPDLSTKLQGLTVVNQQDTDFANPYISNPYSKNWLSFFSSYAPEIKTTAPVKLSLPPFPVIGLLPDIKGSDLISEKVFSLAVKESWEDMVPILMAQLNQVNAVETKKLLALTLGEVLFRAGNYEAAFRQLYLLNDKYGEEYVGIAAAYLLAHLRARHEDIHIAEYALRQLSQFLSENFKLSPFIYLSQIEAGLATGQFQRVGQLLQKDDIALPPKLAMLKKLRQADYWFATESDVKAYVGYQLFEEKSILDSQPYSLNGYCNSLYLQKKYSEAAQCFSQLSSMVTEKKELSMISLKKAMAELQYKTAREMYVVFSGIEDTYPGTLAGFRAALKKTDIRFLSQPSWRKTSVKYYKAFADKAIFREIAEEAALKEAIAHYKLDNKTEAIEALQRFLRYYRSSSLTDTATALLIEILPAHLTELLEDGHYIDALVLAKKSRELFQKNWIDFDLLGLLAKAYHEISILEEAKALYLYLLQRTDKATREQYYLPLISLLYDQANNDLVEDYAAQYFYNYPEGKDRDRIFLIRLQSLIADNSDTLALEIVSEELPDILEVKEIAAALYFKNGMYGKVVEVLSDYLDKAIQLSDNSQFILAESYYQENLVNQAEQVFSVLRENSNFFGHSRYRLAIIARNRGKIEHSLKLFTEIVEKGSDSLWKKLARRELEFHELAQKY